MSINTLDSDLAAYEIDFQSDESPHTPYTELLADLANGDPSMTACELTVAALIVATYRRQSELREPVEVNIGSL